MNDLPDFYSGRALVLAPHGRDAVVAVGILNEAGLVASICDNLRVLLDEIELGAGVVVITEEAIRTADIKGLVAWISSQPPWSDLPFVLITERGAGLERIRRRASNGSSRKCGLLGKTVSPHDADQCRSDCSAWPTAAI